jgi:hypothetical protein
MSLPSLAERALAAVRAGCSPAWSELTAAAGWCIRLDVGGESFALAGEPGGIAVRGPLARAADVEVRCTLDVFRDVFLGERELAEAARSGDLFVTGAPGALVRADRVAQLFIAGLARAPAASELLDELLHHESPAPAAKERVMADRSDDEAEKLPADTIRCDVVVFGAGIAGLTAAHELAERNFSVVVIDPDLGDPPYRTLPEWENPGLGGMARSQWGFAPNQASESRGPTSPDAMRPTAPARVARARDLLLRLFGQHFVRGCHAQRGGSLRRERRVRQGCSTRLHQQSPARKPRR